MWTFIPSSRHTCIWLYISLLHDQKGCRKRGHFVKDCPKISITAPNNKNNIYCSISDSGNNINNHNSKVNNDDNNNKDNNDNEKKRVDICFNCGSLEHTLKKMLDK